MNQTDIPTSFEQTRRDLIAFRVASGNTPALFFRASIAIGLLERLQEPADDSHEARLTKRLARVMSEIEAIKANGGVYAPAGVEVAA